MQRLSDVAVLKQTILSAVSQAVPGPFAYAEKFDEQAGVYQGLLIEGGLNAAISLTKDTIIVRPDVAIEARGKFEQPERPTTEINKPTSPKDDGGSDKTAEAPLPTRFTGSVSLSPDRPGRDMSKIIEGIIEQLNSIEGADLSITLDIHAEVPGGIDNAKRRTLLENADTLKFIDKDVK